jgi:hypothetical protein
MTFAERMLKIDRRIIFLVIGFCTLLPLLYPVGLPIKISPEVPRIRSVIRKRLMDEPRIVVADRSLELAQQTAVAIREDARHGFSYLYDMLFDII